MMNASSSLSVDFLYTKVHNAMSKFDKIFGNIVTICKDIHDQRINSEVLVDGSLFSVDQCEAIVQLSGYLSSIFEHIQLVRVNSLHEKSVFNNIPITFNHNQNVVMEDQVTKMHMKISLLQDMLIQEMNKSEELEISLRSSEAELLAVTEEKAELQKKIEKLTRKIGDENMHSNSYPRSISHNPSTSDKTKQSNLANQNPESFVGRYIRKQFDNRKYFGIISSYSTPFFLVIYEDGDREELDLKEATDLLWEGIIPSTNKNAIARHEKLYLDSIGIKSLQESSLSQNISQSNMTAATDHLTSVSTHSTLSTTHLSLSSQSESHDKKYEELIISSPIIGSTNIQKSSNNKSPYDKYHLTTLEESALKSKIRSVSPLLPVCKYFFSSR